MSIVNKNRSVSVSDTYAHAILRTLSSFKSPTPPPIPLHTSRQHRRSFDMKTVSQSVVNELVNGSSDNQRSLADPSSLSSSSSSLLSSSSSYSSSNPNKNCFTIEAHLPLGTTNKKEQLEKFQRLLIRLDNVYNQPDKMATTALRPPSTSSSSPHIQDRYLFRSLSNDNKNTRISSPKKTKLNPNPISSTTPPQLRKRYKFSSVSTDQNNNNVYKFPNGQTEPRSHSTDSDRYFFTPDDSVKKPQQTLTYVRSGSGIEKRSITFIDGTSMPTEKLSSPTKSIQTTRTTITPDTPYLFSKTTDSSRHPSATSAVNPEDAWMHQRQQPQIIFDSETDSPSNIQLKRARTSSMSPEHRHINKRSPTRLDTVTSTNGSLSNIRQSPPTKGQNVRFDSSTTPRSYLNEARQRLAGKQRGRSPQAFQQSVDRLVSSTNQKYLQQQILSPPIPFQQIHHQPQNYISQYYAKEEDEPPIDYPMDSDDEEQFKRSYSYTRNSNMNNAHKQIMKNINRSLIDRTYLSQDPNRSKQLEQNVNRYLRFIENQALQRELNHDLIRCFSSTYLDDLRREENRHNQTRINMRSYTYEDIQDIHMSPTLESYKLKKAIDRERRLGLNTSMDGKMTSSTPTSSIGPGHLSPLLSTYSPIMTGSLNENFDGQSGGFEPDRRSQKSHLSTSQTPTSLRPSSNVDLFYEIMQDRFRNVDASIAGYISNASQYTKQKSQPSPVKPTDHDNDMDTRSHSSIWSDEDDEQIIVDNQHKTIPNQKHISRVISTVNRSLLDRPSDLIADYYLSNLNRSMQDGVRHVESIARDKALMRQHRNREFIDEPTNKLGRSLSAEHLYQVRKEHLRYRQPFTTPTSFTVEDVQDIYKPFVLENYKRKIAIELERRRREKQEQLMTGISSPATHTADAGLTHVIKSSQPPVIELAPTDRQHRTSNLTRTSILRINERDTQYYDDNQPTDRIVIRPPTVQTTEVRIGRARRTLTDDGSADVVHHIGIISPPPSYSIIKRSPTQIRTSTIDQYGSPQVTIVDPPDFSERNQTLIRQKRLKSNIIPPDTADIMDRPLTTTQPVLIKDTDYDPNLRRPVQIITTETEIISSARRPPTQIYTPSAQVDRVQVCHADRVETDSGNYDLSMVNIRPILTLNQGEIHELNNIAHQAQRLQLSPHDYDRAMIILTPDQAQYQHNIDRQPLLLAAANIGQLEDEQTERAIHHIDQHIPTQHTHIISPIAEHMAKVEQDIPIFENISSANISQPTRNRVNEIPQDSGITSLNTSQASEQPMIFNASRISRLEPSSEQHLENLHEDDYYRKRIRALDLLRHVETDPNTNLTPIHNKEYEIFENLTNLPSADIPVQHTNIIDYRRIDQMQTLERTDEPIIYESIEQSLIQQIPQCERLTSTDIVQDNQTNHHAEENQIKWGEMIPQKQYQSTENQLSGIIYEQTKPIIHDQVDRQERIQSIEDISHDLETPKRPQKSIIYNYGEKHEIPVFRTSPIDSDRDLQDVVRDSARVEYDDHTLSTLDEITQPVSYHPPVQTDRHQQQTVTAIDQEPMAVREETALENEVSYDGSFGRASFRQPIQPLNAPKTLAQPNHQALLLEELATTTAAAVHAQHATEIIDSDHHKNRFETIEQANRVPVIVYDTEWKDEKVTPISHEIQSNIQKAERQFPKTIQYEQAKINLPKPILSRERYEHIENNNQEITQRIQNESLRYDHSNEQMETTNNLISNIKDSSNEQQILCHPIDNQIETNTEQLSSFSDDSLLVRHQEKSNIHLNESTNLENPLRSTTFLTLNYPNYNQDLNQSWQQSLDQQFDNQIQSEQQNLQLQTEPSSPRYLPSISPPANERTIKDSDNYVSEFQQIPLLHENVRIQNSERLTLLPSTQINQSQPIYRVRQQQVSTIEGDHYSPISSIQTDHIDRINTNTHDSSLINTVHIEPPPSISPAIQVHVRPTNSETSSLVDMESVLNRFEDNNQPEQHLPLVDQISLSYTTTIRSTHDNTQRAIERYEEEHPFFSRSLPIDWIQSSLLPHDEQLVEQWVLEKNLETIQQQVELNTNNQCESVAVAAIANDAYCIDERFEDEDESPSLNTKTNDNQLVSQAMIVSHCSPTSDYETDSLDKDNDTSSTTTSIEHGMIVTATPITITLPTESTTDLIPMDYFLNKLPIDNEQNLHRAKENQIEQEDNLLLYNFDENQQELINIFFEPGHFHLPLINEISVYQMSFHHEYPFFSPLNLSLPAIHNDDDNLSSNQYRISQHEILSIAQINNNPTNYEEVDSLYQIYDQPSYVEHYHIQALYPFSETLYININQPPLIIENEDEQSTSSILPDVIPANTTPQNEEYIEHEAREVTILPTTPAIEPTPLHPPFDRTEKARQSIESYNLERLPEQKYVEINISTPTPSIRKVRPTRPGSYTEDLIMENTIDTKIEEHARYSPVSEKDDLHYASTITREQSEHLPPKHLPVEYTPEPERAHIVPSSTVSITDLNKNDQVLIRDTIVQHISEDEKSTSSEEVVFEEWSEEFRCRRTDEYDRDTNRLLRTRIDETSQRVKSDVIKEEYKEKNERIKGHKSYDVIKEVYRRVPAHTVDPTKTTIIAVEPSQTHLYEEIPQPPPSTAERQLIIDHKPRDRHWSSEDIYTTEIVYDPRTARDIESTAHTERIDTRFDSTSPPSSTANYDRVRPGQYPPIPSTTQATISTVPSSTYDRISNIITPSTLISDRRQQDREETVSEEYHVEVEQRHTDRYSPLNQRQTSTISTKQRDETSEEDVSDTYGRTGDRTYQGLTTIVNEAGRRRDSDWRNKLKQVYTPASDEERFDQSNRSRETTKRIISSTRTEDDRPQPPKRSSSSSSIIDERRSRFEQQQLDIPSSLRPDQTDRPTFGRVGELKNAFESTTITSGTIKDDFSKSKTPITTSLTEQRRRLFEEQDRTSTHRRSQQISSTNVVPQRRVHRISGRHRTYLIDEYDTSERRMSETHTAPSRVQSTDRLGRSGFDAIRSSLESSMTKTTEPAGTVPQTSLDLTVKDKRVISSIDSDLSGSSPPIYQSTPKSTKQKQDEDAGHESEDELSDPTNKQDQSYDSRRRTSKTRLRDFSQSTSQPVDTSYISQRTKSTFNETNMENILSHVPTSKGKGLLIELTPHISYETPITSTTTIKPSRDPHKSITASDSGIFDYSTATSLHPATSTSSWRNNASSSIIDDATRTPPIRDSGIYVDSATTASSRYGRRQTSDTDQTTIHGGDDSVSRSTYKYDTEIISNDQQQQQQQQYPQTRYIRRQITGSPPSDYENIANYHSGISSQRKVPITTQSRSILPKALVVDEIETIETETHVECQVQRTHEIKESTTKTERAGSPNAPKKVVTTTTTTTTTTTPLPIRSPETSSDEATRTITPAKRVLLNERPQYYETRKSTGSPSESTYTPATEIRQQTQTYRESGIQQHRYDSPQSDSISYSLPVPTTTSTIRQEDDLIRVEETGFKPIQRDRSQDSLRQSPATRSNIRTLSAGPRSMEITSLSPQNQVTFGKYTPNEIIAIVRVPELAQNGTQRTSPATSPPTTTNIRHGISEPELYTRAKQEEEEQQQRARLHYQRVHATSYRPPPTPITQDYQQRQGRSRVGPYDTPNEYSSPLGSHTRSSSYHAALHDQDRQQQQDQYRHSPHSESTYRRQVQRRAGSLGNLFGPNIEFEIEIEKRPPIQPEQPTIVALDQPTRAIVTTSKDGRVSIQNIAARPGNTVVINSDFHSSDRSLNRSSGYFSSDELRSQGLNTNYSSDEPSSATGINSQINSQTTHTRRYKNNDQTISKLPSHYRPKQQNHHYQHLNTENFDRVNQIVHRYSRTGNTVTGFNDAIDQIDALYNNLDVQANNNSQQGNRNSSTTYGFSKSPSTANRRRNLSQNPNEYSKRYSSTGFQHIPTPYDQQQQLNTDTRRYDTHRALSDNENLNHPNEHNNRNWGSTSLNDLVMATPIRPSQSLSSSGILADYGTPGSISPNSGFGSTQNVIVQQNRLNSQQQIVQRNRTSVKQVKQKSAAKKKSGNYQGQYSDEEDDNDSAGGHDSPLSDTGRPQPPPRFSNRHQ